MRIKEIDGVKYHVIQSISEENKKLVDALAERHRENYSDFVLLKTKGSAGVVDVEPHYLLCRKIEDAEIEEG